MNVATTPARRTTSQDVEVQLRFGVDTGERQAHDVDPRRGPRRRSVQHDVTVHDGRAEAAALDVHGFELVEHPRPPVDWDDAHAVAEIYYPQARALALERSGGRKAFLFDHTVRHGDEAVRAARGVREPAYGVHNDYTHWSARKRMRDLLPDEADTLLERRFAIVQVWRPIRKTIEADPIAIADARRIEESDLIPVNRISPGRVGGNLAGRLARPSALLLVPAHDAGRSAALQGLRLRHRRPRAVHGAYGLPAADAGRRDAGAGEL